MSWTEIHDKRMNEHFVNKFLMIESCGISGRRHKTAARGLPDSELRGSKASRLVGSHADATAEKRASVRFFGFRGHPCPQIADHFGMLKNP